MKTKEDQAQYGANNRKHQIAKSSETKTSDSGRCDPRGTIYFWRDSERHYGFLCQWFRSPFYIDGKRYDTAEHWMMAEKAKLFNNMHMRDEIIHASHPGKAKALGRQVKGFRENIWLQHCDRIVEEGNMHKFRANEGLKRRLLATDDRELVEASPGDPIWGIGFDAQRAEVNRSHWGQNRLGKALMRVRSRLREEDKAEELAAEASTVT